MIRKGNGQGKGVATTFLLSDLKQLETPPKRGEWGVEASQDNNAFLHSFLALFYWNEENPSATATV